MLLARVHKQQSVVLNPLHLKRVILTILLLGRGVSLSRLGSEQA